MADTILVVVEQREGKLNRVSWETITAGQAIAAATGWTLEGAVVGASPASVAAEVAAKKVAKVYSVESPKLEPYPPDAFAVALKQFLTTKQPKLVLMPHTYQVRDFIPKLVTAMERTVISDCVGFKHEGGSGRRCHSHQATGSFQRGQAGGRPHAGRDHCVGWSRHQRTEKYRARQ